MVYIIQYVLLVTYNFNVAASVCMLSSLEENVAMLLVANIPKGLYCTTTNAHLTVLTYSNNTLT